MHTSWRGRVDLGEIDNQTLRPYLGGLRLRLHKRLRAEPSQTVKMTPAPGVELVPEPLAASEGETEPHFRGTIRLRPPFPPLPTMAEDEAEAETRLGRRCGAEEGREGPARARRGAARLAGQRRGEAGLYLSILSPARRPGPGPARARPAHEPYRTGVGRDLEARKIFLARARPEMMFLVVLHYKMRGRLAQARAQPEN
jgi:hypothetical protein